MALKEKMKSWKWRIIRVGHSQASFCKEVSITPAALSGYISGQVNPSIKRFEHIENTLLELEQVKGV